MISDLAKLIYTKYMRTVLSIVLISLLFGGSLGYVSNRLQDPEFLVEQTKEVNLYGRLSGQLDKTLPAEFVSNYPLTEEEIADVIKTTITADEFYGFIDTYSTAYLDYWNSRSDTLLINYSLVGIKERGKTSLTNKFLSNYDKLPVCTAEQARSWDIAEAFPNCQLVAGSISKDSIERQLKGQVSQVLDSLPNEISVNGASAEQEIYRDNFTKVNNIIKITWIAILVLLIMMIAIFRSKAFIPIAISLLFVGLIQIGFSLVAWDWIATNVADYFTQYEASQLAPLAVDMAGAVLEVLKTALGNLTIIILGLGAALLVLGIISAVMRGKKAVTG